MEVPRALSGPGPPWCEHPVQGGRGGGGLCAGPASLQVGGILESERETQPLRGQAQKPASPSLAAGLSWLSRLAPSVCCGVCVTGPRGPRYPGMGALAPAAAGKASPGSVGGAIPRRRASKYRFAIQSPAPRPVLLFQHCTHRFPAAVSEPGRTPRMFLPAGLESGAPFLCPACAHAFGWQTWTQGGDECQDSQAQAGAQPPQKPVMGLAAALGDPTYQQPGPMSAWPGHRLPVTPRSTGCDGGCRAAAAWNLVFWTLPPCRAEPSLPGGSGHEEFRPLQPRPGRKSRACQGPTCPTQSPWPWCRGL